ncbi:MAG TPA: hypothetical protein VMM84_12790 [Pyrinomonadaceae bacterium]|nr:hypothetical protein [Pyrinomonadaceae bacterium]
MTQPLETARQDVQEKAAHELLDREREQTLPITVPIVFPGESDVAGFEFEQPVIGDGDAMGVNSDDITAFIIIDIGYLPS